MSEAATFAVRLGAALEAAGLRPVTAESCTGGGVAEAVTAVPVAVSVRSGHGAGGAYRMRWPWAARDGA